jgi:hypothetical protein
MVKKKRGRPRVEHLIRSIEVRSVHVHMSMHIEDEKSPNPRHAGSAWMEVRGVFDEPVKGQTDVVISVHEERDEKFGTVRPAVVGHLIQMRPECRIVVGFPTKDFDRAWALAAGGKLTHAWLSMTVPHYNNAAVPSVSFANEPIE